MRVSHPGKVEKKLSDWNVSSTNTKNVEIKYRARLVVRLYLQPWNVRTAVPWNVHTAVPWNVHTAVPWNVHTAVAEHILC